MNKIKKNYITIGIIIVAIIFLIVSKFQNKNDSPDQALPTRDTVGLEGYATIEEFCADFTASQEFDDSKRAESFYKECLVSYSL